MCVDCLFYTWTHSPALVLSSFSPSSVLKERREIEKKKRKIPKIVFFVPLVSFVCCALCRSFFFISLCRSGNKNLRQTRKMWKESFKFNVNKCTILPIKESNNFRYWTEINSISKREQCKQNIVYRMEKQNNWWCCVVWLHKNIQRNDLWKFVK